MSPNTYSKEETQRRYLQGELTEKDRMAFEAWLVDHPEVANELHALQALDQKISLAAQAPTPEPTGQMDQRFYAMLAEASVPQATVLDKLLGLFKLPQIRRFAYGAGLVTAGVFVGHYGHLLQQQDDLETFRIQSQQQQIQALAVLSMLEMPSANKRIMAIQLAGMNEAPDDPVFDALLNTLVQDDNVNVRLEALEVLANHSDKEQVRIGLLNAITQQQSPTLQVALSQLMLALKEKAAVTPIKELIEKPDVMEEVKQQLNQTINELI